MKKLSFLLLVATLFLAGCDESPTKVDTRVNGPDVVVSPFEYKGHAMILVYAKGCNITGVEHDPECPKCQKVEKKN